MIIKLSKLRALIRETLYTATAPKRYNLPPVEIDAVNTRDAGEKASQEFFARHGARSIDPLTIDVAELAGEVKNSSKNSLDDVRQRAQSMGLHKALVEFIVDYFAKASDGEKERGGSKVIIGRKSKLHDPLPDIKNLLDITRTRGKTPEEVFDEFFVYMP